MDFTPDEFIRYGAIAGIILGFLLGLIILILGIKRKKTKLGIIGLILSTIVGPISGLLSIVVAAIFIWLIIKKPDTNNSSAAGGDSNIS